MRTNNGNSKYINAYHSNACSTCLVPLSVQQHFQGCLKWDKHSRCVYMGDICGLFLDLGLTESMHVLNYFRV